MCFELLILDDYSTKMGYPYVRGRYVLSGTVVLSEQKMIPLLLHELGSLRGNDEEQAVLGNGWYAGLILVKQQRVNRYREMYAELFSNDYTCSLCGCPAGECLDGDGFCKSEIVYPTD